MQYINYKIELTTGQNDTTTIYGTRNSLGITSTLFYRALYRTKTFLLNLKRTSSVKVVSNAVYHYMPQNVNGSLGIAITTGAGLIQFSRCNASAMQCKPISCP